MKNLYKTLFFVVLLAVNLFAQPTLQLPGDFTTVNTLSPTFTWDAFPGATGYRIQISEDNTFATTVVNQNTGLLTSYTVTSPLEGGKTYYWHVKSNLPAYSTTYTFYTEPVTPSLTITGDGVFGDYFADGTTVSSKTIVFANTTLSDIVVTPSKVNLIGNDNFSVPGENFTVPASTTYDYYIELTQMDIGANSVDYVFNFAGPGNPITVAAAGFGLTPPTFTTNFINFGDVVPGNEAVYNFTITNGSTSDISFSWEVINAPFSNTAPIADPTSYTLLAGQNITHQIKFNPTLLSASMQSLVITYSTVSSAWGISPLVLTGTGVFATPVLTAPVDGAFGVSVLPTFNWDPVTFATRYYVLYSTDVNFGTFDTISTATNSVTLTSPLLYNKLYYWRIYATDGVSQSAFSNPFSFTTVLAPPVLISPADNSFHQPTSLTFTWNAVTGADTYTFELADDVGFTNIISTQTGLTIASATVAGLTNYTQYYWRVKAVNSHCESEYTDASFRTKLAPPVLVFPANNSTNQTIVPLFDWNSVVGGNPVTYTLQVAENAAFTVGVVTTTSLAVTEFQYSPPANVLDNNKNYYYRVSATDIYGTSDYSNVFLFTTVRNINPVLSWPIGGSGAYTNPQLFSWYLNEYAPGTIYDFELSLHSDLTSPIIRVQNINATTLSQSLNGLPGNVNVYWRIASKISPTVVSHFSAIESFTIQVPGFVSLMPNLSHPIGGTTIYGSSTTLYWYLLAAGTGLTYDIEINTTGTFTGTATYTGISNLYYEINGLVPGGSYYWKVRSFNGSQYSDWSELGTFVINGSTTPALPVPSWPIGGNMVYSTSPTLYWYLNEYAVGLTYQVELNTTNTFTGTPTIDGLTSLYHTFTGLTAGETYYWKVRSFNGTTPSEWSLAESFEIYGQVSVTASVPVPSNPISGTTVYTQAPTLSWYLNGPGEGLKYEVEINTTNVFSGTATFTNISDLNYELSGLTLGQTYYWKVRSYIGTTYSDWSSAEYFVVVGTSGSPVPVLSWPVGGATTYSTSQNLFWYVNASGVGLTYQIELSATSTFTGTPTFIGITNTSFELSGLTEGQTVYWRVRSFDGVTPSSWSAYEYFVVYSSSAPLMPISGSPASGVIINTNSPTISWALPAPNAGLTYELEISTSPDMSGSVLVNNLIRPQTNVTNLENNSNYYWRVRSKTSNGNYSNYSNIVSFNTGDDITSVEDVNIVPSDFYMTQNYPNPFNPNTNIKFGLPNAGNVKIIIYNALGQEIKTLINKELNAGTYNLMWNGQNESGIKVPSGVYLYRIISGNFIDTKKMILIK
ncbi:MAG: FlgD immunoglobulin-like domain containing protein [bacterium]